MTFKGELNTAKPPAPSSSAEGEAARELLPAPGGKGRLGSCQGNDAAREPFAPGAATSAEEEAARDLLPAPGGRKARTSGKSAVLR